MSVETVKKAFGTKRDLLREWFEHLVAGEEAVPIAEQSQVEALASVESLRERIWLAADALARTHARVAPAYTTVAAAAQADPEIAVWWHQERKRRMQDVRTIGSLVLGDHDPPRPEGDLYAELYAMSEPHVYLVLTGELAWSNEQYTKWFARAAMSAMTTPDTEPTHKGSPT